MTEIANTTSAPPRILRSIWAIFAGFLTVFALSLGIDQILHIMKIYPPWGQPMWDPSLNALALAYRIPIGIFGSYLTARLAPANPMRHAMIGGAIGFVLSTLGAIAGIRMKMGPAWYPIALALTALPCAWIGGRLWMRSHRAR